MTAWNAFGSSTLVVVLISSVLLPALFITKPAHAVPPAGFSDRLLADGLDLPVAMEFAPDGRLFVSEKNGAIRIVENGTLLPEPFASLSVNSEGERGLQGIAFDPNFSSNGYLYVYYTTAEDPVHNRVSRLAADPSNPDVMLAGSERPILDLEPLVTVSHNGGALEFGPDGKLYVSTGDNYFPHLAQSATSRFGKILRINPDGTIPTDNPFYNTPGAYREIWALGLRNPFSSAFSSNGEKMYVNDVGQDSWEEINLGSRGANYGWPSCEGMCSDPSFESPLHVYPHPSGAGGSSIAGGAFYEESQFPSEFQGSYFFGDYAAGFIKRLTPDNQEVDFLTEINSPVDVEIGPEGHLYYLSIGSGQLRKVHFTSPGNYEPVAVANANQTSGLPPVAVNFDGSQSTDPNSQDDLSYSWDFGDGSAPVDEMQVTHTYNATGFYVATLTVDDGRGSTSSDSVEITVGNPPVGTIQTPSTGTRYSAGDTISFSGSGSDEEDASLAASAFDWNVLFHHNTHTHPFQEFHGVRSGTFTIPTVGETENDVWYRIYLTVRDSSGLTHESTRDILPNTSTVTLASNATGLELMLDGQPHSTPHSFEGVAGTERTLEAPASQVAGGLVYNFQSWSDGGNRTRTIATPSEDATLTAYYSAGTPAPQHTLEVLSADMAGNPRTGHYATIESPRGTILESGYTPLSFTGYEGTNYSVIIRDYRNATFDRWEDDSMSRVRSITMQDDTAITAYYRTIGEATDEPAAPPVTYDLAVNAADLEGNTVSADVAIESPDDGTVMSEGETPLNYTSTAGNSYHVVPQDQQGMVFERWEDGSTNRTRTVTLDSDTTVTAHYRSIAAETPAEDEEGEGPAGPAIPDESDDDTTDDAAPDRNPVLDPLDRVQLQSSIARSGSSQNISEVRSGEQVEITAMFRNDQQSEQSYAAIIQTMDSEGFATDLGWETGVLSPGETASASRALTPDRQGLYTIKILVWDGVEQTPAPLSEVQTRTIAVN